jgi:hypothetical protein
MAFGSSRFQVTEIHLGRLDWKLLRLLLASLGAALRGRPLTRLEHQLELVGGILHRSVAIAIGPGAPARRA